MAFLKKKYTYKDLKVVMKGKDEEVYLLRQFYMALSKHHEHGNHALAVASMKLDLQNAITRCHLLENKNSKTLIICLYVDDCCLLETVKRCFKSLNKLY